jgi:hypothetical protein
MGMCQRKKEAKEINAIYRADDKASPTRVQASSYGGLQELVLGGGLVDPASPPKRTSPNRKHVRASVLDDSDDDTLTIEKIFSGETQHAKAFTMSDETGKCGDSGGNVVVFVDHVFETAIICPKEGDRIAMYGCAAEMPPGLIQALNKAVPKVVQMVRRRNTLLCSEETPASTPGPGSVVALEDSVAFKAEDNNSGEEGLDSNKGIMLVSADMPFFHWRVEAADPDGELDNDNELREHEHGMIESFDQEVLAAEIRLAMAGPIPSKPASIFVRELFPLVGDEWSEAGETEDRQGVEAEDRQGVEAEDGQGVDEDGDERTVQCRSQFWSFSCRSLNAIECVDPTDHWPRRTAQQCLQQEVWRRQRRKQLVERVESSSKEDGWEEWKDADGQTFYHNRKTGVVQDDLPYAATTSPLGGSVSAAEADAEADLSGQRPLPCLPGEDEDKDESEEGAVEMAVAIYDFHGAEDGDLDLTQGEELEIVEKRSDGWWQARRAQPVGEPTLLSSVLGRLKAGDRKQIGWCPSNYLLLVVDDKSLLQSWKERAPVDIFRTATPAVSAIKRNSDEPPVYLYPTPAPMSQTSSSVL